ncbi:MAG: hypothetical protein K2Y23_13015 [Cyanobacteria bacterium]|nr:hypothetical protein [Cyanobacteriota bacterium]
MSYLLNPSVFRSPHFAAARVVIFLIVTACAWPSQSFAQAAEAYRIELVEAWIRGHVNPERVWNNYLSKSGISFEMTAEAEARLRAAGADDEWIAMLRRATVSRPISQVSVQEVRTFQRRDLRPLYFGTEARIAPYVSVMQLQETGGDVNGYTIQTSRGLARLRSTPLPDMARTYGLLVDFRSVGLDIEGSFQRDLLMLNMGLKYSPFLPLGTSGFRALVGVKPFLGFTRQILAHFPKESSDEQEPVVDLMNNTYGGDVSAGLAYHWRPGYWIFGEVNYRMTSTFSRELRPPDGAEEITEGIPWSKWSARGLMFRMGVGF